MTSFRYLAAVAIVAFSAVVASGATPKVPEAVGRAMQDRNYDAALKAIDEAVKDKDAAQDYLAYLKGRALHLAKKYDDAVAAFDAMSEKFPKSEWARRARFAKGLSLARRGNFLKAEQVYRAEAEYLLSLDRKQELADIYLEFADAYFKPAKEETKPDYAKAREFYQNALEVGPKPEKQIEIELLIAQCYQKLGDNNEAVKRYQKFITDHAGHAREIEARFRLGESFLAAGNMLEARRTWQDSLTLHKDAKSERLPEAMYNISLTYNIPSPSDKEQLDLGVAALKAFAEKYPEHKLAAQAHLRIAQSYHNFGRHEDAVKHLKTFLADARYAKSDEVPDARQLLGLAYKVQGKFDEALAAWADFLAKHPTHQAWSNVQRELVNTEFAKAHARFIEKQYDKARELWTAFLAKYPLDERSRGILYRFGQMNYAEEKWDAAIADWRRLVSKYPDTDEASQAQFMIALVYEEKLGKLDEALKEYKKTTWGSFKARSEQRVARLTAKDLQIATERVFRSGETPAIKLTTRNIDAVTVRVYSVDLETYFRKMHLSAGVEKLDIALIDPDKTFEFKIPEYKEYQKSEHQVAVPLPRIGDAKAADAGVLAVTVSSKTLEATTLLLQSDLDMIVKSSRDELFVFTENLRTGKPWPKARVLISNGTQVFAEGVTGDDGVFQKSFPELKTAENVRVFAIADRHAAANYVGLSGVNVAQGLTEKGYIYTDRPAYRSGQMVHVRGIIRKVAGDTYTVDKSQKYRVDVYDNRNRLVNDSEVSLNDFGSFHTHFVLPAVCPQGEYRILVHDADDKESYQGTFVVHEYQLEPVRIDVDAPRSVYYRGEEIEGKIKVSFYYGAPLADRDIRYRLADGRVTTAKTDDKGEVAFKLPTRDFRETQNLQLVVELPERNLTSGRNFFLATQGFTLNVETVRPVYLAGETFEVKVKAVDAEGNPLAQALTLNVYERTLVDGKVGEVFASKHELKTGEKDGLARQTLKLEKGADYVLRAEGIDRFTNPVTAEKTVSVSDDKDATRLRILAEQHTFKVGDTANVQLHWREAPALALVTYQGAKILQYQLVSLQKGANKLEIPMTAKLAPNFELAVAVMTDARAAKAKPGEKEPPAVVRFHEATSPFMVERDLKVKIEIKKKGDAKTPPIPGDDIEVTITATDAQGKPAKAELSLAMVEQALLSRFSPQAAAIGDFFRAGHRESAVRTTSSVTFSYNPQTRPINAQLLAEKDRVEVKEDESRRLAEIRDGGIDALAMDTPDEADDELAADRPQRPFVTSIIPALGPDSNQDPFGDVTSSGRSGNARQQMLGAGGGQALGQGQGFGGRQENESRININAANGLSLNVQQSQSVNGDDVDQFRIPRGSLLIENYNLPANNDNYYAYNPINNKWNAFRGKNVDNNGNGPIVLSKTHFDYKNFAANNGNEVQVLMGDGSWGNTNFGVRWDEKADAKKVAQFVVDLGKKGAILLPNLPPHETGYWNPVVATDDKGLAVLIITLPERSTAWNLHAKGITADTLAGEASTELAVKKELFGDLKLPASFTDGDSAQIIATVHNDVLDKGQLKVVLKTTLGGKSVTETKTIDVKAKGLKDLTFTQKLELPADAPREGAPGGLAEFELTITAGDRKDVLRRSVPVQPHGTSVYTISGGTASGDVLTTLEQPAGMKLESPRLQIVLGPTVEQSLLDVILAPATWCQYDAMRIAAGPETAAGDVMAALALQKLLGASRDANTPQAQALDARVRSSISLLVSLQNDDGGWSWAGEKAGSDRYNSARVVWALALAKGAGYRITDEIYNKALTYLQTQLSQARVNDYETRAVLVQALASAGQGDFNLANQLYRNRPALTPAALAHLALAFAEMDRKQTAGELLDLLAKQNLDEAPKKASGVLSWTHAPAELRAIYALALDKSVPADARLKEQVDWLMAHRTGHRWNPEKATGPAMLALCQWFSRTKFKGEHYKLNVFVNDLLAKELDITEETTTQTIDVPVKLLSPKLAEGEKQRIRLELVGRGRFTYQCVLGGFVAGDKLAGTTKDWTVARYYEPAPLEFDGQAVPRGFDILTGSYTHFRNDLSQLPVGQRGRVELEIQRHNIVGDTPAEQLEYLVVTEPIPAGATVVESSITGNHERFEVGPGSITFYIGSHRGGANIAYEIHGYLPGSYRTLPTIVRNAYRADQMAVAQPKPLAVLPLGGKSADKYRLSPRELFELGKRHFDKGDFEKAAPHLSEAFSSWNLAPDFYKEAVRMLLKVRLKTGPPADVVKFFEIIVEKYPDLVIAFEDYTKIGDAYHKIGEYERSYLVFRTTVEASFQRESYVAGSLQSQGHFLRSVDLMSRLLREYPPEGYVASATYALAQRVYAKAPEAAADTRLREAKVNRVDLIRRALAMLDNFLTGYPDDPAADQASFSLANALLDLDAYQEAIDACKRYAVRFAESDYLDSYWYIIGFCHYARGEHKQALEMCNKVAEAKRLEKTTGRRVESPNKWQAIYILGQIHHSLGEAVAAIREYERVKDRFEDARQAIQYFSRKEISLPEVTTFKPGEGVSVDLKFRNVAACDATVYKIDLLKFSLLRRSLGDITNINLSGIRPYHEAKIKLGDGQDYRDRTTKLEFPLKDEGAYLVVCRGDDLHASGLVLVTPLAVEVQEETDSGRVRATVRDKVKDKYVHDVHVKVIGTRNADFTSGETDLRGVFVADSIQGKSMVIAQAESGRYAFFRGATELGPAPAPPAPAVNPADPAKPQGKNGGKGNGKEELLDWVKGNNKMIQQQQEKNLNDLQNANPSNSSGFGGGDVFKKKAW